MVKGHLLGLTHIAAYYLTIIIISCRLYSADLWYFITSALYYNKLLKKLIKTNIKIPIKTNINRKSCYTYYITFYLLVRRNLCEFSKILHKNSIWKITSLIKDKINLIISTEGTYLPLFLLKLWKILSINGSL